VPVEASCCAVHGAAAVTPLDWRWVHVAVAATCVMALALLPRTGRTPHPAPLPPLPPDAVGTPTTPQAKASPSHSSSLSELSDGGGSCERSQPASCNGTRWPWPASPSPKQYEPVLDEHAPVMTKEERERWARDESSGRLLRHHPALPHPVHLARQLDFDMVTAGPQDCFPSPE
jgi:hypothetical protein